MLLQFGQRKYAAEKKQSCARVPYEEFVFLQPAGSSSGSPHMGQLRLKDFGWLQRFLQLAVNADAE